MLNGCEKTHPNYIMQHLKNVNELDLMLVPSMLGWFSCVHVCYYPQFIELLSGSMLSASGSYSLLFIMPFLTLNPTEILMTHRKKKNQPYVSLFKQLG